MNILILGNGFDLAHHLPTQYSNFLDFVKAFKDYEDNEYSFFLTATKENNPNLYQEMQMLIESNVLIDYFLSIYHDRCKRGKKGWIDFESEISIVIQKLDEAKQDVEKKYYISNKPVKLEKGTAKILNPIIVDHKEPKPDVIYGETSYGPRFFDNQGKRLLDALNRLTRLLEIYLFEYVEKLKNDYIIEDLDNRNIDHVLSFNYTDTYKKKYDPEGKINYCFIHGKAKESNLDNCNLVLGIDEYLPKDRKDTDNQFVWFKKFYQRIFKETGSEYIDWIKQIEDSNNAYTKGKHSTTHLTIYGHSLDETDKDVLSKLIMMDDTITYIFYHNREAMAKQINNLVKVIGEENLIRMTGGKDRLIRFVKSREAIICDTQKNLSTTIAE